VADAVRATAADTRVDLADLVEDEAMTRRALDLLGTKRSDAYEATLAALREDTWAWWADALARDPDEWDEDKAPTTAGAPQPAGCAHAARSASASEPTKKVVFILAKMGKPLVIPAQLEASSAEVATGEGDSRATRLQRFVRF
jgi:hypothetical protein